MTVHSNLVYTIPFIATLISVITFYSLTFQGMNPIFSLFITLFMSSFISILLLSAILVNKHKSSIKTKK